MRPAALALLLGATLASAACAAVTVKDDLGNEVTLAQPARRIITLAPHVTELLYAAGAGDKLVGASNFSDFPAAAIRLPSVGSFAALDLERVLNLKPDLIVAWHSGNKPSQLARLRGFGIPIYESQPADFDTIADSLEKLARLAGSESVGTTTAQDFRARWQALQARYGNRPEVSVFYQIWSQPLMTLNGRHMVSSVLKLCGGRNIFADLPQLAPTVTMEAVLAADPQVILAPGDATDQPLERWRQFGRLQAVRKNHLYQVNADWLNRAGPRILEAASEVCERLDAARAD
ncbi:MULTISPECIES: cobalamin-binding protein [unclassified Herbaspirillum]|uniref:cobalamin-binding protein n=1 Tax=unclassified Herbaspirillum TaxID=2624150 RepID=UPI0011532CF6|nr:MULTISPECIES: cobalamin-binding protein [unclassified Herbaspirillum]MBB5392110.1 iron complex transport system substrate-binding protein [Herbaspirillum sp. SJZ102]TQK13567.1 iron complex transport system substrate-binding protein [Herbaspirillum sp. SJZ130]TQK15570.1 iron complex transport system substrate-binding protein [Herbaspirillum sp. SJZ106]